MQIIHGDDYYKSRNFLNSLLDSAKAKGQEIYRLEAKDIDITSLQQISSGTNLFGQKPTLVIFNLFSQTKSKQKDKVSEYLKSNQNFELIIYESKTVNGNSLKAFANSKITEFKPASIIFELVESFSPGNSLRTSKLFFQCLDQELEAEFIFAMLVRQIRLLILATDPSNLKLAPWQKNKIISQSRAFSEKQLLSLHQKIYRIDRTQKRNSTIPLKMHILELILSL